MLLSALSVLVVAQSSSEIPEGPTNNPVYPACSKLEIAWFVSRLRFKCAGTRAESRFRLSAKRTSPFKSPRGSVQSTTGSRAVRISGSNPGYTMFRGSVKGTGYPLQPHVSPSFPLPCVTVCHHISTGLYTSSKDQHFLFRIDPDIFALFYLCWVNHKFKFFLHNEINFSQQNSILLQKQ